MLERIIALAFSILLPYTDQLCYTDLGTILRLSVPICGKNVHWDWHRAGIFANGIL